MNKNSIPYDINPPLKASGIRVGTPALTTRGMKEPEMRQIGAWIAKALEQRNDDAALERIRGEVAELANQFPLYAWRRAPHGCRRSNSEIHLNLSASSFAILSAQDCGHSRYLLKRNLPLDAGLHANVIG